MKYDDGDLREYEELLDKKGESLWLGIERTIASNRIMSTEFRHGRFGQTTIYRGVRI